MATFIFDFDGTIANSFSLACNIIIKHANDLRCKQLKFSELNRLKNMHAHEVLQYLEVPFWRTPLFVQKLRKILNERVNEIDVFPEWLAILSRLNQNGHQIGLLSSNSYKTAEFVLKKYHLFELFDFISCEKSLFGKKKVLLKVCRRRIGRSIHKL
ncbi:MAG: HAD hydrolase-like protein [Legionella sp.]|nr:HAD hydrolase-like protein [Legionella sp.]